MSLPHSLQARLGLSLGLVLTLLWIAAAWATSVVLRHEMGRVFDSALQETAQRILPLAVVDIIGRDEDHATQRIAALRTHEEFFTYILRDADGHVLISSHAADPAIFPAWTGPGFAESATHRFYSEETVQGTIRLTVAEPLAHRAAALGEIRMALILPLLVVLPLVLLAAVVAVRASLAPVRRFRAGLDARGARDLAPVPTADLPAELVPAAATLNALLARLAAAFEAERSFAANAAHELRTPLAGAIAQAQRLKAETGDAAARERAAGIEATLKRLTRLSERLMQLARAEGGRLRLDRAADLRPVIRIVADDLGHGAAPGRILLSLPDAPVPSDLDPDAFAILCRNLIENALRHGDPAAPVEVELSAAGTLTVANDGPALPPERLSRLTARFERAEGASGGSGLGLAIANAIAERSGGRLTLRSPRPGSRSGFEAKFRLPPREPRA
ncbi:MAG: HAMP domain-containing histidine kinase [Rhodobacteraceae bacterium]|nr:HAMP domain-containing histidine kinase [Paracoccaceae bacterium]MCP5340641.1 HAMP domain-containing histidine kinase [Paracoccaceae bacterium]